MTVAEFKEKLKEFELAVVTSPLNESELTFIELILSRKLPNYYREFLLTTVRQGIDAAVRYFGK